MPQRRSALSMTRAFMAASSAQASSRSFTSTLPFTTVCVQRLPSKPKRMCPSMFASEKGVKGR